jgi:hypothetical protein
MENCEECVWKTKPLFARFDIFTAVNIQVE